MGFILWSFKVIYLVYLHCVRQYSYFIIIFSIYSETSKLDGSSQLELFLVECDVEFSASGEEGSEYNFKVVESLCLGQAVVDRLHDPLQVPDC